MKKKSEKKKKKIEREGSEVIMRECNILDSFTILMCVAGSTSFIYDDKTYNFKQGQTVVLPAKVDTVQFISARATILEVTV